MKRFLHIVTYVLFLPIGFFIGLIKGQDARTRFLHKARQRDQEKRMNIVNDTEVMLDDYEIESYHN